MNQKSNEEMLDLAVNLFSVYLAEFVKWCRVTQIQVSQFEFAELCNLSQRMISYIEHAVGFSHFDMISLIRVACGIGVLPSDIFRKVELDLLEDHPEVMHLFLRNRKIHEEMLKKWTGPLEAMPARLLEILVMVIQLLNSSLTTEIRDEDLDPIRKMLRWY